METRGDLDAFAANGGKDKLALAELLEELLAGKEARSGPAGINNGEVELLEFVALRLLVVVAVGELLLLQDLLLEALLDEKVDYVADPFEGFAGLLELHVDDAGLVFASEELEAFEIELEAVEEALGGEELLDLGLDGFENLAGLVDLVF